ncbi:aconitate hydratase AcnA [Vagococcus acidifermentans]|uniref:Aconitate hydratase n=1 Tax=Vagococcus acidifermentans TaxID=564710 RepID=A0A430B364_9ENTE|nr:aconitate hydratase AcnA [Vagococcus acidifermentans]RSU14785.1 aconitate hydratase 1 [Vagococcus acidifermentans]
MSTYHDKSKQTLMFDGKPLIYFSLSRALQGTGVSVDKLPYTIRILLESLLRQEDGIDITEEHITALSHWQPDKQSGEIPFKPARVILQDFTGVPAIVDLASMREALVKLGGSPEQINPEVPVDLVVDHSVQVDAFGTEQALATNSALEFQRNKERYEFLKWAQTAFSNYRVVPPATGIVHQVNIEYLADVVTTRETADHERQVFPDTVFGTDSHTPMVNALGVLGWGVGGIEAEACMLGEPSYFPVPEVIGVRLTGKLGPGATATDVALKVTQVLREKKVVGKFVEYFGEGIRSLTLADRATIANMSPENGATCGFFPVDDETLHYLTLTGRDEQQIKLVETYLKANDLFYDDSQQIAYSDIITIDLTDIEASLAGPKRPQDLILLPEMKQAFQSSVTAPEGNLGFGLPESELTKSVSFQLHGTDAQLQTGDLAIAAITSCTNTSNPYVMLAAGLLARNAVAKGLTVPDTVKTSLAPGSQVVTGYLTDAGLMPYLEALGFNVVGYGCTTCIGNSGPLEPEIEQAIRDNDLLVASVLSGNRNFEGRIHPLVKANYLASPPLVIAYALAGKAAVNLKEEPLGKDQEGQPVYLADIWPDAQEINQLIEQFVTPEIFRTYYAEVFNANEDWNQIVTIDEPVYQWDDDSTYIANPPFFDNMSEEAGELSSLQGLRVLAKFGDSVTTDHISPAGAIGMRSPAGKYLQERGVAPKDFNSFGSRRGHHEVMMRGTFGNIRIRNQIAQGTEGGVTTYWPTGDIMPMYDAAMAYKQANTGLVILAGNDYGMGSSRDWAAKGSKLLGVQAVIAKSYERIHRSNLVMMGILPLQFVPGEDADSLGLTGEETFAVELPDTPELNEKITVTATAPDGTSKEFQVILRFDAQSDIRYYQHQGILPMVIRKKLQQ